MASLDGSQVHAQVKAITEGGNIRTTPRGSPRVSRDIQVYYTNRQPADPPESVQKSSSLPPLSGMTAAAFLPSGLEDDDGIATPTALSPNTAADRSERDRREKRRVQQIRPPPILKKAGSGGSSRSTSSRSPVIGTPQLIADSRESDPSNVPDLSSTIGDQSPVTSTGSPPTLRYTSTRFSEEVAVSIPQSLSSASGERAERLPRSLGDSSRGASKRAHVVHSGSATSKKRPVVMRQRSSQASSVDKPSPDLLSHGLPQSQEDDEGLTMVVTTERRRRAASPHPGKRGRQASPTLPSDEDEDEEEDSATEKSDDKREEKAAKEKVEEDTRENTSSNRIPSPLIDTSQAAHHPRPLQHRSFTNLPSAAWRSTTTTSMATSYNASGMMFPEQASSTGRRGSNRAAFKEEIIPLKAPAPAGPDITDEAGEDTALPRTKSQLTLLLERNKGVGHDPKGKGPAKQ